MINDIDKILRAMCFRKKMYFHTKNKLVTKLRDNYFMHFIKSSGCPVVCGSETTITLDQIELNQTKIFFFQTEQK